MEQISGGKVLVVDDEPVNTNLLKRIFLKQGHDVLALNQSRQLMETIEAYEPDVIILDVMMPERNGYELTQELKASANWRHIPIVLLTALAEQEACIKGLEAGAEDFVTKPFNRRELCARVSNLIKLKRFGDFLQQNIRALEAYDAQTGLPKPALLKELAMPLLARQDAAPVHFILCKAQLSKSLIHTLTQGEFTLEERQIYRAIVERINKTMPLGAVMGSLDDHRIGVFIEAPDDDIEKHIQACHAKLRRPFMFHERQLYLPFALALVPSPYTNTDWDTLLRRAEIALTDAERHPGHGFALFAPEADSDHHERMWLSQALHTAHADEQFQLYYQPQVEASSGRLLGFEVLLRWPHQEKGYIPPTRFIPIAEANGTIHELSLWVFEEACKQARLWQDQGRNIRLAINVSQVQLHRDDFADQLLDLVRKYDLTPERFELELTESTLGDPQGEQQLQRLREQGFSISIDDFGTGYSNLAYLKKYPVDRLKIDRGFVQNLATSEDDAAIIRAIIAIADSMNFKVIAEGIETPEQLEILRDLGCHEAQGYLFGRPEPVVCARALVDAGGMT